MKQYKNLWIWLAVIVIISGIISHWYYQYPLGSMMDMQILMWVWFLVFGSMKLPNIKTFAEMFAHYDPLAKHLRLYGHIYPLLEIILGIVYLIDTSMQYSIIINSIVIVITLITSIGIGIKLSKNNKLHCVCMWNKITTPLWRPSLIEQIWMCAMAIWMIIIML